MARRLSLVLLPLSVLLVFAGGCSEPSPAGDPVTFDACESLTLVPDAALTDAQVAGVRAAIALWNASASTRLAFRADTDVTSTEPAGARLPIRFQPAGEPFHGFYDAETGRVFVNEGLQDHAQAVAIAHEIGHAFALAHTTEHPSVMRPGNLDTEPTDDDVAALAALWGACPSAAE